MNHISVMERMSALPSNSVLKRVLRAPLRFIPPNLTVPVLTGPLRGKRWIVGSSVHACWVGIYDAPESRHMQNALKPGSVFFDIGAQAGYHTLAGAKLVGPTGRVFAFEPAPCNLQKMHEHVRMNRIKNVTIVPAAVSDGGGFARFDSGKSAVAGHLCDDGALAVRMLSLDEEIDAGALPDPDYVKIDAEGAELRILTGASRMLKRRYPVLSIETHQWMPEFANIREECIQYVQELGYTLAPIDPNEKHSDTHLSASRLN